TDPQTGYRYYSARQLPRLNRILALKELGLSLDQIGRMLEDEISPDELRGMLMMKKAQIEQMLHEEMARMRYIETRISQIDLEGNIENYEIVLKEVPAKKYLSLRSLCEPRMGIQLARRIHHLLPRTLGSNVTGQFTSVLYSDEFSDEQYDLSMGFQLDADLDDDYAITVDETHMMTVSQLPAEMHMLTITRVGHPRLGTDTYAALGTWAEANGYELTGNLREVYINFAPPDRIQEMVVEIQYPAHPKRGALRELQ
ncbi:MAG: MerR family transcriptional regulator, partial [Chloroflexota bacterium]